MRKAMLRKPLPAFIDPVHWLLQRRIVKTHGAARDLILAGRLKAESHTVGITTVERQQPNGKVEETKVVARVPAAMRHTLRVAEAS
jgi:hypothetical protein